MKLALKGGLILALTTAATAYAYPLATAADATGSPGAGSAFARRIDIAPTAKWINVQQDETVELVNGGGQKFLWRFDTTENVVPLERVAPPDFLRGQHVDVYVMHQLSSD